jgi:hypothetical protein
MLINKRVKTKIGKIVFKSPIFILVVASLFSQGSFISAEVKSDFPAKIKIDLRPRLEVVDSSSSAAALTYRTQAEIAMPQILGIKGLGLVLEATKVSAVIDQYNSNSPIGGNVNASKATVIDPLVTSFTKAYLSYTENGTIVTLGTQPINLDNQRFIGSVGWRQMPQTFGTFSLKHALNKETLLYAAYLYRRNGIQPENDLQFRKGSLLLNGKYTFSQNNNVTAYAYLLEGLSNTFGLRGVNKMDIGDVPIKIQGEYALQKAPTVKSGFAGDINSYYLNLVADAGFGDGFGAIGYEILGDKQSGNKGFSTPYATLHAFNGWSDVLLGKVAGGNNDGLKDLSFKVGLKNKKYGKAMLVYHRFDSLVNSVTYGSEIDLLYAKKVSDSTTLILKAALYENGGNTALTNTKKYWVMTKVSL